MNLRSAAAAARSATRSAESAHVRHRQMRAAPPEAVCRLVRSPPEFARTRALPAPCRPVAASCAASCDGRSRSGPVAAWPAWPRARRRQAVTRPGTPRRTGPRSRGPRAPRCARSARSPSRTRADILSADRWRVLVTPDSTRPASWHALPAGAPAPRDSCREATLPQGLHLRWTRWPPAGAPAPHSRSRASRPVAQADAQDVVVPSSASAADCAPRRAPAQLDGRRRAAPRRSDQ